jgi:Tol biopolymer transport system component
MPDLKEFLDRGIAGFRPDPDALDRAIGRARRRLRRQRVIAGLCALALCAAAIGYAAFAFSRKSSPHPAARGSLGQIAFGGGTGISLIDGDGSHLRFLARGDEPAWSPDGRRIAFVRWIREQPDVWVMNADGTDAKQLTHDGRSDLPTWSPEGTRIAFITERPVTRHRSERVDISVMNADGSHAHLISARDGLQYATDPAWSPDGNLIAFAGWAGRRGDGTPKPWHVYVMRVDGTGVRQVGTVTGDNLGPTWSPDGSRIAVVGPSQGIILTMSSSGTDVRRLVRTHFGVVYTPAWSPDGNWIAFAAGQNSNSTQVYLIGVDGRHLRGVTHVPAPFAAISPAWRPVSAPSSQAFA